MFKSPEQKALSQVPLEIAPGVHCLEVGKGIMAANVYFVQSGSAWVLIDAGTTGCAPAIQAAADRLFGPDARPVAILLTHDHPDHAGSALPLARAWAIDVLVHPDEMPIVLGGMAAFQRFANPLDRWLILPLMRMMGTKRAQETAARASFKEVARSPGPRRKPTWPSRVEDRAYTRAHAWTCRVLPPQRPRPHSGRRPADRRCQFTAGAHHEKAEGLRPALVRDVGPRARQALGGRARSAGTAGSWRRPRSAAPMTGALRVPRLTPEAVSSPERVKRPRR